MSLISCKAATATERPILFNRERNMSRVRSAVDRVALYMMVSEDNRM